MNYESLKASTEHLLLKCISGSKAYGLDSPSSDTDLKGVFVLPREEFFGLETPEQLSNDSHDVVYFELRRFVDLLVKNNPNILELLFMPSRCILYRHPLFVQIQPERFLSRLCKQTFAGYAQSQIKKAKGLNKKIMNPLERERRGVLDYCHVVVGSGTVPVKEWLARQGWRQEDCGLTNVPHFRDGYALYHMSQREDLRFAGIQSDPDANEVSLSSIPKGLAPVALMCFNKDGYSQHCRDYREYWEWVEKRNDARYRNTLEHGKKYDAKNMMHTFRLLAMAEEIARDGKVIVERSDREFLLSVKRGDFEYNTLLRMVTERLGRIDELFERSPLPETPDMRYANDLLINLGTEFYESK